MIETGEIIGTSGMAVGGKVNKLRRSGAVRSIYRVPEGNT
jgi:hypothetical protein